MLKLENLIENFGIKYAMQPFAKRQYHFSHSNNSTLLTLPHQETLRQV
jgi:hypothetical protein